MIRFIISASQPLNVERFSELSGEQFGYPSAGATTVGIVCKDGVVLASEKRVAYGFL